MVHLGAADKKLDSCSIAMDAQVLRSLGEGASGHILEVRLPCIIGDVSPNICYCGGDAMSAALKIFRSDSLIIDRDQVQNEISISLMLSKLASKTTPIVRSLHAHTMEASHIYDLGLVKPGSIFHNSNNSSSEKPKKDETLQCMSMELCQGGNLKDVVEAMAASRGGELMTENEAASCIYPVAEAIQFCHSHGYLHLDVKPENVLLRRKGKPETACLSDFSLAMAIGVEKPTVAMRSLSDACRDIPGVGTDHFMAPEVGESGHYSPLADVYSLGCVLLYALTGISFSWQYLMAWRYVDAGYVETLIWKSVTRDERQRRRWADLSWGAKEVIKGMLCPNPLQRLNMDDVLSHAWLKAAAMAAGRDR